MKKTYIQPTISIVKTDTERPLMAGSADATSLGDSSQTTTTFHTRRSSATDDWDYWDEEEE